MKLLVIPPTYQYSKFFLRLALEKRCFAPFTCNYKICNSGYLGIQIKFVSFFFVSLIIEFRVNFICQDTMKNCHNEERFSVSFISEVNLK